MRLYIKDFMVKDFISLIRGFNYTILVYQGLVHSSGGVAAIGTVLFKKSFSYNSKCLVKLTIISYNTAKISYKWLKAKKRFVKRNFQKGMWKLFNFPCYVCYVITSDSNKIIQKLSPLIRTSLIVLKNIHFKVKPTTTTMIEKCYFLEFAPGENDRTFMTNFKMSQIFNNLAKYFYTLKGLTCQVRWDEIFLFVQIANLCFWRFFYNHLQIKIKTKVS